MTTDNDAPQPRRLVRRLWWLWAGLAAVLALLVTGVVAAAVIGIHSVRGNERAERAHTVAVRACADLETRLNRLVPPGATKAARQRAAAIRAENAALVPFLADLDRLNPDWGGRRLSGQTWSRYVSAWHRLADERAGYAAALDREASGGDPAFFQDALDESGSSAGDVLRGTELRDCGGVVRRLTRPDL
jgi:hypothetical protein